MLAPYLHSLAHHHRVHRPDFTLHYQEIKRQISCVSLFIPGTTISTDVLSWGICHFYFIFSCVSSMRFGSLTSPLRGFTITFIGHATLGSTPLDEWSARRRDLYRTTQHSRQTNIHAPGGIRTHNLSNRAAADPCFRPRDHWGQLSLLLDKKKKNTIYEDDV